MPTQDANGNLHDTSGLFTTKGFTAAPDGIVKRQPSPSATANLTLQVWRGEEAVEIGTENFEISVILDTMHLYEVEDLLNHLNYDDRDRVYEEAVRAGIVERHNGPTAVTINEWEIEDYLEYRRDNDLAEPILDDIPFSQDAQNIFIGEALHKAYGYINVTALFEDKFADGPDIKAQFKSSENHLYWLWKNSSNVPDQFQPEDEAAFRRISAVASRVGHVHARDAEAQLAAVTLMEWLLKRDAVLAERTGKTA